MWAARVREKRVAGGPQGHRARLAVGADGAQARGVGRPAGAAGAPAEVVARDRAGAAGVARAPAKQGQQGRVNLCRPAHPPRWAAGSGFVHRSTWETKHEQTKQVQTRRTDPIDGRPGGAESARARAKAKAKAEDGEDSNRVSRIGDRNHRRFNCVVVAPLTGPFRPGASAAAPLPEQSSL